MSDGNDALSSLLQASLSNPAVNDHAGGSPFSAVAPPPNTPAPPPETQNAPITGELQEPGQAQNLPQIAPQQPQRQPPQMGGTPLIARYLMDVIRGPKNVQDPNTGVISQQSRGDQTLNFLGEFLGNMAAGFQQSGHGPGANLRGAGAAMMAPYQRALAGYQLGQQQQAFQSQQALQAAQAEQYQQQQVPIFGPDGTQATNPDGTPATMPIQQKDVGRYMQAAQAARMKLTGTETTAESREKVAQIQQGMQLAMPPEIAAQVGIPAGTMLGKGGWDNVNKKLAAQGKNIQMGDIGNGHVGLVNKANGQVLKDFGEGQYVKRAEASAYFQAKFGVVPVQGLDENGDTVTYYTSKLAAPGMAPAAHSFDIVKGKAGLNNYKDALGRINDNLDVMNDPVQRGLVAQTLRNIGTIHDPGVIASTIGGAISKGLDPKSADLVAATLQAREFIGANRQFAGNLKGSEALYQRMVANVPGPMNSPELNRALIKQDLANTEKIEGQLSTFQKGAPKATPPKATTGGKPKTDPLGIF